MRDKWLTPQNPAPTALRCRRIYCPNDPEWLAAINGALIDLTKAFNWSDDSGGQSPTSVAAAFADIFDRYSGDDCMIGVIFIHAASQAPSNSLPCDGQTYNRSDYPDLFDHLDAAYHVGSTQFKTPDLRGRTVLGDGQGSGLANRPFATAGGTETHTLSTSEMPSHQHAYTAPAALPFAYTPGPAPAGAVAGTPANTVSTGGGGSHNNMQPYLPLHYAIWAK